MPSASDHKFDTYHLIPSVTYCMNIKSCAGDSLYSGGEEIGILLYVYVHDATFDPSNGINHAAILLRVMRNIIDNN